MSEQDNSLSQQIIDMGDDFQPDAMDDFDDRVASGEFTNKTTQQIRDIYLDEAIQTENDAVDAESIRAAEEQDQCELDHLDGDDNQ